MSYNNVYPKIDYFEKNRFSYIDPHIATCIAMQN